MPVCTQCGEWFEGVGVTSEVVCRGCLLSYRHPPSSDVPPPAVHAVHVNSPDVASNEASQDFDAYYTWLGIPPARQPPNHYQLLGVTDFEQNADVISNAADRQMTHLRSFAIGPHSSFSQQLLSEVASARICLLNSATKAAYEQGLRVSEAVDTPPVLAPLSPDAPLFCSEASVTSTATAIHEAPPMMLSSKAIASQCEPATSPPAPYVPKRRSSSSPPALDKGVQRTISTVIGGLVGLVVGWFIIFVYLPTPDEGESQPPRDARTYSKAPDVTPNSPQSPRTQRHVAPAPSPSKPTPKAEPSEQPIRPLPEIGPVPKIPTTPPTPPVTPSLARRIPSVVRLPELTSLLSVPVASLPQATEDISLRLLDGAIPVSGTRLTTEERSEGDMRSWTVAVTANGDDNATPANAVAEFVFANSELQFKWLASTGPEEKELFENCAIRLSIGSEHHTIAMREPQRVKPLDFDMDNQRETHQFSIANRPALDHLLLELGDLRSFPAEARFKNDKRDVSVGKTAVIEFDEMPGAELEVRFIGVDSDEVGISVAPIFREDAASRVAMTKSQLEKTILSVQGTIARTQSEIQQRSREVSRLAGLSTSRMSSAQLLGLRGQINKLRQAIKSYEGRLGQLQATLAAGPKMSDFIDSLHEKVRLNFNVIMLADEESHVVLIASE